MSHYVYHQNKLYITRIYTKDKNIATMTFYAFLCEITVVTRKKINELNAADVLSLKTVIISEIKNL